MAMQLPRYRRHRSGSKDRPRIRQTSASIEGSSAPSRGAVCAFAFGSAVTVVGWTALKALGVRGPWATPAPSTGGPTEERLQWLVSKRNYLIDQLAIADEKLEARRAARERNRRSPEPWEQGHATDAGGGPGLERASDGAYGERGAGGVGVHADGHFILGLSSEEFAQTSVDKMMAHYDTHSCDRSFGNGLVNAWRQTGKECCHSGVGADPSSIRCHLVKQEYHHGKGDNLVQMKNVQVDLGSFEDPEVARQIMQAYAKSKHSDQPYVRLPRGAVQGTCATDPSSWRKELFPGWNADWTSQAFMPVQEFDCDEWIEHPVMVMQRDTFANFFHDSEDFVNAFLAMAILRHTPGDTQIFLTDLYPEGPFWSIWERAFGVGRPALTAWQIGQRFGSKKTCFRDLTIGIYGPAAPTTLARLVTACFHTALVRSYSDFIIRGLGLQGATRYASPPSKTVVVTWMARRSSVKWPERAFCSETGKDSFFTCDYFQKLGTRQLQRKVLNEVDVLAALRTLETRTFGNGAIVEVRDVDYNLLSFEDQVKNDLETDVMIGPHGAGLFHIIFTPDRAALIELQIDKTTERKHFHNLAKWSGHAYVSRGGPNPVPVEAVKGMVVDVIDGMDLSAY